MAPYSQRPPAPNASPGSSSVGRGGYNNGGRGNRKKSRGGYNGNGNTNGRAPSYGNNNNGPRAAPDMPPYAGAPTNCGGHYGSFSMPPGGMGGAPSPWPLATAGMTDPASMDFQPRDASFGGPMPLRVASSTSTPTYTIPIVTPSKITMPAAQPVAFYDAQLSFDTRLTNGNATWASQVATTRPSSPRRPEIEDGGIRAEAPSFIPLHTLASHCAPYSGPNSRASLDLAGTSIFQSTASKEDRILPIDAYHENLEEAVGLLDREALIHPSQLSSTKKAELQQALTEAHTTVRDQEASAAETRAKLLSKLQVTRDQEKVHNSKVKHSYDRFVEKLTEACKQGGDKKEAGQIEAISYLNRATQESHRANKCRNMIETCRDDILLLDCERMKSTKVYADAIHSVVVKALRIETPGHDRNTLADKDGAIFAGPEHATESFRGSEDAAQGISITNMTTEPEANNQNNTDVGRPVDARAFKQDSVFERQPPVAHRSIDEVLDRMKVTKEQVGLNAPEEKVVDNAVEAPKQQAQKDNGIKSTAHTESRKDNVNDRASAKQNFPKNGIKVNANDSSNQQVSAQPTHENQPNGLAAAPGPKRKKYKNKNSNNKNKNSSDGKVNDAAPSTASKTSPVPGEGCKRR